MSQDASPGRWTRRGFLAASAAGTLAAGASGRASGLAGAARLPQRVLGRTGQSVPILGLGTAPGGFRPRAEAIAFYNAAIDAGITYLDTAPEFAGYGKAQVYLGEILKERRDEVFVVTKCWEPDGEKALALLKKNLAELQIERADLVYAHTLGSDNMPPDEVLGEKGVCKALEKAQRDGLTRFVGVSGHNRPERFLRVLREWDFDVMMNAVSLASRYIYDFEHKVWPVAAARQVGLVAMKVYGGWAKGPEEADRAKMPDGLKPAALRYALNLPNMSLAVVGIHNEAQLKQNLEWIRDLAEPDPAERAKLEEQGRALAAEWGTLYGPV
jgi:aryl-alcohol dehydrogenase-like predicted oxidoreductase